MLIIHQIQNVPVKIYTDFSNTAIDYEMNHWLCIRFFVYDSQLKKMRDDQLGT